MQAATVKRDLRAAHGAFPQTVSALLKEFADQRPIRAGSLVVSLLGDAIVPRGGSVWLGNVIDAVEPFGISDRLVRTSVSRLTKQGWLEAERIGRRSFYSLTDKGLKRFTEASRRIYQAPRQAWQGNWCLALIAGVDTKMRDELRRELAWLGFAPFSSNLLAHPDPVVAEVEDCLNGIDGADRVVLLDARAHDVNTPYFRALVGEAWQLDDLGERYRVFLERFRPVYLAAREGGELEPKLSFCMRVLLIHDYRRILLKDPLLPPALLPERWDGAAAFQLCRNLYRVLAQTTEEYLSAHIENAYGPLPPADDTFYRRFGGLDDELTELDPASGQG